MFCHYTLFIEKNELPRDMDGLRLDFAASTAGVLWVLQHVNYHDEKGVTYLSVRSTADLLSMGGSWQLSVADSPWTLSASCWAVALSCCRKGAHVFQLTDPCTLRVSSDAVSSALIMC